MDEETGLAPGLTVFPSRFSIKAFSSFSLDDMHRRRERDSLSILLASVNFALAKNYFSCTSFPVIFSTSTRTPCTRPRVRSKMASTSLTVG